MSQLTELFADLEKEFSQGNRQERELSRADVDTSDLIKNDAALLTGLGTAATLPYTGPSWLANFVTRAATPAVSKMYGAVGGDMVNQSIRNMGSKLPGSSGSRVGTDVAGRNPMPMSKAPVPTNRGPRGNTNIEQPTQGNLDLTKLKDTGITSLTNRMNPKMRNDLLGRRDRIQQDVYRMNSMQNKGEPVDMNRLFRLQDELDALNKTLK